MDKKTIEALHKSIAHWNDICYGMEDNYFSINCALCQMFTYCDGCPINKTAGGCDNSEWKVYHDKNNGEEKFCTVDSATAAEAMLEMLVSLLPKDEQSNYRARRYMKVREDREFILQNEHGEFHDYTGITTDGRNAFPQAKYVWEKVFDNQRKCKITFEALREARRRDIGSYNWVAQADRARQDFAWNLRNPTIHKSAAELMVKDGKCVTCNQPVKRKVTKYKVVMKARPGFASPQEWEVSSNHWVSVEAFNNDHVTLVASCIIPETAKEFDVE